MNTMKPDISLSEQIPVTEPERQYYYIEKAKEYVKNLEAQIGHQPTFCVVTFRLSDERGFRDVKKPINKAF